MFNKKGFTLVELMAVIAIIGILSGIAIMAVSKYQQQTQKKVYENYEKQLKDASVNYYTKYTGNIPTDSTTLELDTLISESLIEPLSDPVDNSKKCMATVSVTNQGNVEDRKDEDMTQGLDENGNITESNTVNIDLKYEVCLECSQYKSKACK